MKSAHKVVGDMTQAGLLRMIGTIAVILPAVALAQVLANAHDYRQPAAVIAVWAAVLVATAWLTPRMRARGAVGGRDRGGDRDRDRGGDRGRGGALGSTSCPAALTLPSLTPLWPPAVVGVERARPGLGPAALTVYVVHSALLIRAEGLNPLRAVRSLSGLATPPRRF